MKSTDSVSVRDMVDVNGAIAFAKPDSVSYRCPSCRDWLVDSPDTWPRASNSDSISRKLQGSKWRVIGREHICYFTPVSLARAIHVAGFPKAAIATSNIDPNEIKKAFSRSQVEAGAGFQTGTTEELRHQLETRPALRLAKSAANVVLRATSTGDTIVVRAER